MCIICEGKYNENTTFINCSKCINLTEIPMLPKLTTLQCEYCIGLTEIPMLPKLITLDCINLKEISDLPKLLQLDCGYCTSLTKICDTSRINHYFNGGSTWIRYDDSFNSNMRKLIYLQSFCRNNLRYWRFKRWLRSKEFAEWFYSPNQWGGKACKLQIKKSLEF
uniref:Uncharacterized protein n=1 Tax=viral metagenome TaxID=1070528 RepID=A0A6C0ELL1_9ZZZZ